MKSIQVIIVGIITYCLLILLCGCYTRNKAQQQFARSTVTYPEIAADYCGRTYPVRDSFIRGKDVMKTDTLWGDGETIVLRDTIRSRDTVFIKITNQLPGKVIERTYYRTDTIKIENTAALDLSRIEMNKAINLASDKTIEADKWRKIAKKRFWIILGMGAVMALGIFALIKRKMVNRVLPI